MGDKSHIRAFTFVEVMIALAIASISVVALTGLHLTSVRTAGAARAYADATLVARQKLAETLAAGLEREVEESGTFSTEAVEYHWQTRVAGIELPELAGTGVTALRRISVDVTWEQGAHSRQLQISTIATDRSLR